MYCEGSRKYCVNNSYQLTMPPGDCAGAVGISQGLQCIGLVHGPEASLAAGDFGT